MKHALSFIVIVLLTLSVKAQSKVVDSVKKPTPLVKHFDFKEQTIDTLSFPKGVEIKAVKVGNDLYTINKVVPGIFQIDFNADTYYAIIGLIEQSNGSHTQVEAAKKFFIEQLKAKGLIKK